MTANAGLVLAAAIFTAALFLIWWAWCNPGEHVCLRNDPDCTPENECGKCWLDRHT